MRHLRSLLFLIPLLAVVALAAGCNSVGGLRPALMEDVDAVSKRDEATRTDLRAEMKNASQAQKDTYTAALASGKTPEEATALAFGAGIAVHAEADKHQPPPADAGGGTTPVQAGLLGLGAVIAAWAMKRLAGTGIGAVISSWWAKTPWTADDKATLNATPAAPPTS